jgi:hypothetical protein
MAVVLAVAKVMLASVALDKTFDPQYRRSLGHGSNLETK